MPISKLEFVIFISSIPPEELTLLNPEFPELIVVKVIFIIDRLKLSTFSFGGALLENIFAFAVALAGSESVNVPFEKSSII